MGLRRVGFSMGVVCLLAAAGCQPQLPQQPPAKPEDGFTPGGAHLMPRYGENNESLSPDAATAVHLNYYGGHVIPNVKVVSVFWGPNVNSTTTSQIGGFFSSVTNSPYFDWLSEYDTTISGGTNQHIGRGNYYGAVTIAPSTSSTSIDDSQIQSEINSQISAGHLPAPDANTLYMTYFPHGTTITQGGSQSCVQFCAYHGTFTRSGSSVYYGVIPDLYAGSGCDTGCGSSTNLFNNVTSVTSHEMIEAVTDAEIGLATQIGPPIAWYDTNQGEIGDICNGEQGTVAGYTVQKEWDNATSSCIVSKSTTTGDQTPPVATVNSPTNGTTVSGTTTITASATDNVGVTKLEIYVDGTLLSSATTSQTTASWNTAAVANGTHSIAAKAYDAAGNVGTSPSVSVTVANSTGGGTGDLITNGGFEGSLNGWTLGGVKKPIDSVAEQHTGANSLRCGATTGYGQTEPNGDSWAYQTVTIPSTATTATLSFWYFAYTTDTITYDWQDAQIRSSSGAVLKNIFHMASNAQTWTQKTVDVSAYRGQTIQVWFNAHGDGYTDPTTLWVDDVSLKVQ